MMGDTGGPHKPRINLLRGWPAPQLLPATQLREASRELLADPEIYVPALQYGPDPGPEDLRDELASWLARMYNVAPDPCRICVSGGASQNLARILQTFTEPSYTQAIWMVAPCYYLACPIFEDSGFGGRLRAVPEDAGGVNIEYLSRGLLEMDSGDLPKQARYKDPKTSKIYRHVVYVVPTSANPSGKTMSLEKRTALVHLARKHDALVIGDDVYDSLRWPVSRGQYTQETHLSPATVLPRLCDIDMALGPSDQDPHQFGNTVSNGSFSKIVAPGIRTGWAEGTPAFAYGLSQTGSTRSGGSPSQFGATLMCKLLKDGTIDSHVQAVIVPALQRRHVILLEALDTYVAPLGVRYDTECERSATYGGYFVWLCIPESLNSEAISEYAKKEENLIVGHGRMFEVYGDENSAPFRHHIRLSFSWESEDVIVEGVRRLASVIELHLAKAKEASHEAE